MSSSYWDLSEEERARLTDAQVEAFVDHELMRAGVLRPAPLVLVEEPTLPEPDLTVYVTKSAYYAHDLVFASADDAMAHARKSIGYLDNVYIAGSSVQSLRDQDTALAEELRIYSRQRLAECREQLEKGNVARTENEKRKRAYEAELDAARKATEGMWEDWHRCTALARETQRILETFEKYKKLAKDDDAAVVFLREAFGAEEVERALSWKVA